MYRLNEAKMFLDMADDQAIVINSETGIYYAMNMLSSHVLTFLTEGVSVRRIEEALRALPGCPEDVGAQLHGFVARLLGYEILEETPEECEKEVTMEQSWLLDGFELTVKEYDEVAQLILADPVHDVDEEFGWPALKEEKQ